MARLVSLWICLHGGTAGPQASTGWDGVAQPTRAWRGRPLPPCLSSVRTPTAHSTPVFSVLAVPPVDLQPIPRRLVWSFYPHFMIVASETQKGDGTGLRSHCWRIRGENGGKSGFSWLQPPEGVTEVRLPRCSSSDSRAPFISLWIHNSLLDTSFWMHCWQFHVF